MTSTIDATGFPIPRGPWLRGKGTVTIEEVPVSGGWSLYHLPDGKVVLLMESSANLVSYPLLIAGLWRAVANLTRVCPTCRARARLDGGGAVHATGTMEHEADCPLSDDALRGARLYEGQPLDALPAGPKTWIVCPPRLAIRPKGGTT